MTDDEKSSEQSDAHIQRELMTVAHMFVEYRDDPIMRNLCKLAMKCTREQLIKTKA
jgi:hypothetical protein